MFIDLGDLSKGMGMIFMREFMETAEKMSCGEGRLLFRKGDATHYFFTLIQGELRLAIGGDKQHVYTVRHAGDIFGWSSLVGGNARSTSGRRNTYSSLRWNSPQQRQHCDKKEYLFHDYLPKLCRN